MGPLCHARAQADAYELLVYTPIMNISSSDYNCGDYSESCYDDTHNKD